MTTLKQIEANRRNAQSSTGPRTEAGKERASRNAVRHGLTAETVIEPLEDAEDYQAFEEAVAAGFDAETAVERELILRLASLLWRLRRATSIETGLFQIGSASAAEHEQCLPGTGLRTETPNAVVRIVQSPTNPLSNRAERANRETAWDIPSDASASRRPSPLRKPCELQSGRPASSQRSRIQLPKPATFGGVLVGLSCGAAAVALAWTDFRPFGAS